MVWSGDFKLAGEFLPFFSGSGGPPIEHPLINLSTAVLLYSERELLRGLQNGAGN